MQLWLISPIGTQLPSACKMYAHATRLRALILVTARQTALFRL